MSAPPAHTAPAEDLGRHRGIITLCAMIATLMQALDSTIANVALPYMQGSLSTTTDQVTWVLTSYIVAAAIMTSPVGWLASRFGRKRFFIVCLVGFTVASMLCGLAESLTQMVIFRLLQGVFGAALVPLSQATMLDIYPVEQRGSAMAIWGMGVMVGPILGPTLGGYLTDAYNWRWVFYVNVPFGIVAVAGLVFFLRDTERNTSLRFDWLGFAVLSLGIGALQLMLDRGEQKDWFSSTEIVVEAVLAGLGIYLFVVHLFTAKKPFIPPRIFYDRNFLSGLLLMFGIGMILLASSALLAPYLQTLGGYPVATAGLLMAPRGIGTMVAMMVAGRLSSRLDPRLIMMLGILMLAYSLWDMTYWTPDVSVATLTITTVLQGFGLGFVFIPLQVVAYATLAPELRTDAAALFSLVRNIGSAIGISVMAFLLSQNTQIMHATLAEHVTPFNRLLQSGAAREYWNIGTTQGLSLLDQVINRQAAIIAYANDFKLMLLITLPTMLLLLMMRRPGTGTRKSEPDHAVLD
ncbi:DHA2 family efflux MFS transporter permease subunit [Chelatococcus composti]|jgi:DHA2 family multidrug resistance protein|uniref:DHA2 family multidrug resistance protein n=1 Tax=Chelatococcus composti TaxID=1743235 RepID=A0A841KAP4_9HYPH|nr:DHA2 family efflux MFS transporter permease subunit [Chelatococcus composti]MBB6169521.1 DHA2 family multidrug resistance protein [Chelatococcus composti]MBS7736106.1 DHA2 family efflux MFS transporter permease subunit [Chelatococcus composti]PZN37973.1 MAG: EmrB/QacA family drug resistance transporter [Pseudomonadota bacterium]GGG48346.1 EmrB/QacA family drug resistance transporter [Chelatococcus composti]